MSTAKAYRYANERLGCEHRTCEDVIRDGEKRGQMTPWVRHIIRVWEARNPPLPNTGVNKGKNPHGITNIEVGALPIVCGCAECGDPAVIFPPEEGSPPEGYCVCQRCSFAPKKARV